MTIIVATNNGSDVVLAIRDDDGECFLMAFIVFENVCGDDFQDWSKISSIRALS